MYAAVDIGGTKTLVAVFTPQGEVTEQIKFPTPSAYEVFISELATNVANLSTKEFQVVGVAAPGKIDHIHGALIAAGNLPWQAAPIQSDLEKIFHAPVRLENDAKAATLAEARTAGEAYPKVVYITISTGVGIGVCQDGQLIPELEDAELGWTSVEHEGRMVPWEKIASGKAIVTKYGKRASDLDDPAAWEAIARNISKGLISVIAMIQPNLIVFGGGVGNHLDKFKTPLMKYLKTYESPLVSIPEIRESAHPEEAVIYGCYELAKDFAHK